MPRIRVSCKKDRTTLTPSYIVTIDGEPEPLHLTAVQDLLVERPIGSYSIEISYKGVSYKREVEIQSNIQPEITLFVKKNPARWALQLGFLGVILLGVLLTNLIPGSTITLVATVTLLLSGVVYLILRRKLSPLVVLLKRGS